MHLHLQEGREMKMMPTTKMSNLECKIFDNRGKLVEAYETIVFLLKEEQKLKKELMFGALKIG